MYYCMIDVHFIGLSQATGCCNKKLDFNIPVPDITLINSCHHWVISIQVSRISSLCKAKIFLGLPNQLANYCILNYNFANDSFLKKKKKFFLKTFAYDSYKLVHTYKKIICNNRLINIEEND